MIYNKLYGFSFTKVTWEILPTIVEVEYALKKIKAVESEIIVPEDFDPVLLLKMERPVQPVRVEDLL